MRFLARRRVADAASVVLAGALLNAAVFESLRTSTENLALFAAAAIAAEAMQRAHDELLPDALEGERFALTSPIHVAAMIVAGPRSPLDRASLQPGGCSPARDGVGARDLREHRRRARPLDIRPFATRGSPCSRPCPSARPPGNRGAAPLVGRSAPRPRQGRSG